MTFSDTKMMELGRKHPTNIYNTRLLIRTLKYVLDILQTEEAFTVEEYKHTHTRVLIYAKLRRYFLKYTLINASLGPSNFLMVLNYYAFHQMQF